jgi:uncharacterized protein YaiI (UPF0178 family)
MYVEDMDMPDQAKEVMDMVFLEEEAKQAVDMVLVDQVREVVDLFLVTRV